MRWYRQPVKRRFVVAFLAFFGFCVIYMLRVNLSVAIVAMTANQNHTMDNGTIAIYPDFTWDSTTKGIMMLWKSELILKLQSIFIVCKHKGEREKRAQHALLRVCTIYNLPSTLEM